jgi:hypothetical protein
MPIDPRARDLAVGIAAALDAGEDVTPAKLEIVRYLLDDPDPLVRATRMHDYVSANAAMIALLMEIAQRWYAVGFNLGGTWEHMPEDSEREPPWPSSADIIRQLTEGWDEQSSDGRNSDT